MYFATVNPVRISYKGGVLGVARIQLVEGKVIQLKSIGNLTIKQNTSYLEFNCNGFVRAGLNVEEQLSDKLVKENANGTQNLTERVKANFRLEFSDLNDIVAVTSIEPFQIKGVPRLSFEVINAVVNLNDTRNGFGMVFPVGYTEDLGLQVFSEDASALCPSTVNLT